MATVMKAAVFVEPGRIVLDDKPIPDIGPNDALLRITTTTVCGTDVHILKGEYPVAKGLTSAYAPLSAAIVGDRIWQVLEEGSEKFGPFAHGDSRRHSNRY